MTVPDVPDEEKSTWGTVKIIGVPHVKIKPTEMVKDNQKR